MPVYVYACECGHKEDVMHSINAVVAIVCPDCTKDMARKPGLSLVTFKGGGWGKD